MKCETYNLYHLNNYKFVVIMGKYHGDWILCKHKSRDTWEMPGGHIELGETPLDAAKRELYEETGAVLYTIKPVFDYWAADDTSEANGMVFFADVQEFGDLPESEMEKVRFFDAMPQNLTYKDIYHKLVHYLELYVC